MATQPNFSGYLRTKTRLAALAKRFGYVQIRNGVKEANLRAFFDAIGEGRFILSPKIDARNLIEKRDLEIQRELQAKGILTEIKPLHQRKMVQVRLMKINGQPASQTIIEDRR